MGFCFYGAFLSAVFFAALPPGIYPASVRSNVSTQRVLPFICGVKRIFGACKRVNKELTFGTGRLILLSSLGRFVFCNPNVSECQGSRNRMLTGLPTEHWESPIFPYIVRNTRLPDSCMWPPPECNVACR